MITTTNILLEFAIVLYVLMYGATISFYIVSLNYDREFFNRPKLEYKASDYYEHEYKEEFDNLEPRELSEDFKKSLLEKTILEKTPKGEVLMFYNYDQECFWYYFTGSPGTRAYTAGLLIKKSCHLDLQVHFLNWVEGGVR